VEIDAPTSTEMSAALAARIAIVREVATRPDALARAIEAAQIVASLTQDEPLAAGVLAHEALEPEQLENAGLARALGAETLRAAHELARFGEFGGSEQWSSTRSLSPVQAETLRKMVLGIVSDPRLVVARIAIQLAHRIGAVAVFTFVLLFALKLVRTPGMFGWSIALLALACAQVALGIANVKLGLPLHVAVLHNAGAALLLFALVTLLARLRQPET